MSGDLWLPLGSILADDNNQPRTDSLDDDYIEQLVAVPELWPPIAVAQISGQNILLDGFHRFEAARRLGLSQICARLVHPPTDGDLVSLAFELNAQHGRPLSIGDRRNHARHLLQKNPAQSDRAISRSSGIAASTVASIRRELEDGRAIAPAEERVGSDGRTYPYVSRQPGELPDASLTDLVADGVKNVFDKPKRREMRKTTRYLQRLAVALYDATQLPGWTSFEEIAQACHEILGRDKAQELAAHITPPLEDLFDVVKALKVSH